MLGRSFSAEGTLGGPEALTDPDRALMWLAEARRLAAAGFEDSLGLAVTTLEADTEAWRHSRYEEIPDHNFWSVRQSLKMEMLADVVG